MHQPLAPHLLTLAEAAEYVRRSTRTVRRWIDDGFLRGAIRIKQKLLIPRSALDALAEPAGLTREMA